MRLRITMRGSQLHKGKLSVGVFAFARTNNNNTTMKTYKTLKHFEKRLRKGIDWGDWIRVKGREYKMVEYGDSETGNYMMFQNKRTTVVIQVNYQVPCSRWIDGVNVQTKDYKFHSIENYHLGYLYRY